MMIDALLLTRVRRGLNGNTTAVEHILSDIPFFAVGLLAFGVMTFLLALKRVNLHTFYLYASILLAFSGGILDLSQVLSRGTENVNQGLGAESVSSIINTREVVFALSVGLRLLFYWVLVACCPSREFPTTLQSLGNNDVHSASWARWGIQGAILKWITCILIILVAVLQIVWRVSPQFRFYSTVYLAETAIGIVVSFIFILKLLLNVYLSSRSLLQFRSYAAPMVAIIFNISVGIGNAVSFGFSETTLGRFLQAVELYILVEYLLIATFYRYSAERFSILPKHNQEAGLSQLPSNIEKQMNKDMPPTPPTPVPKSPTLSQKQLPEKNGNKPSRHSRTASRLSTWVNSRRTSRRPLSGEQLWLQSKAELGMMDGEQSARLRQETPDIVSPLVQEAMMYQQSNLPSQTSLPRPPAVIDGPHSVVEEVNRVPPVPTNALFLTRPTGVTDSVDIPSYYGLESPTTSPLVPPSRPLPAVRPGADLSVYGLEAQSNRSSVVNEALDRQQKDFDKSIAALQQFSPNAPDMRTLKPASTVTLGSRHTSVSESISKPESAAASEFSLSYFPEPPEEGVTSIPAPRSRPSTIRSTRTVRTIRQRDVSPQPPPPIAIPQVPREGNTPSPERDSTTPWFGSAGTQFDVTSFIGGLIPPTGVPKSGSALGSSRLVDSASPAIPALQEQYLRDIERRPILRPLKLAPLADSGISAQSAVASVFQSNTIPVATATQPLSSSPFNARNGLPPRPRMGLVGPRSSMRSPPGADTRPSLPRPIP